MAITKENYTLYEELLAIKKEAEDAKSRLEIMYDQLKDNAGEWATRSAIIFLVALPSSFLFGILGIASAGFVEAINTMFYGVASVIEYNSYKNDRHALRRYKRFQKKHPEIECNLEIEELINQLKKFRGEHIEIKFNRDTNVIINTNAILNKSNRRIEDGTMSSNEKIDTRKRKIAKLMQQKKHLQILTNNQEYHNYNQQDELQEQDIQNVGSRNIR